MCTQALALWQKRGHDEASCRRLAEQMHKYRQGMPPYDARFAEPFVLKEWWAALDNSQTAEIVGLAIVLASVQPSAAEVERVFSSWGGQQSRVRSRLGTHLNMMMTTIRTFNLQRMTPAERRSLEEARQEDLEQGSAAEVRCCELTSLCRSEHSSD
jgi:hypothetical protein